MYQNIKNLKTECLKFEISWKKEGPTVGASEPKLALSRLINFRAIYDALDKKIESAQKGQRLFGLDVFRPTNFYDIENNRNCRFESLLNIWQILDQTLVEFENTRWDEINLKFLVTQVAKIRKDLNSIAEDARKLRIYVEMNNRIQNFASKIPPLQLLKCSYIRLRHWKMFEEKFGVKLIKSTPAQASKTTWNAKLITSLSIESEIPFLSLLEQTARYEQLIEEDLKSVEEKWRDKHIIARKRNRDGDLLLLDEEDTIDLLEEFEDSLISLVKHATSPYFCNFKEPLKKWINILSSGKQNLKSWLQTQKQWKLLSSFLKSNALAETLHTEGQNAEVLTKLWTRLANHMRDQSSVLQLCAVGGPVDLTVPAMQMEIEKALKSAESFLLKTRMGCPRLFFLSNADVFQILDAEIDTLASKSLSLVFHGLKAIKTTPVQKDVSNKMNAVEHVVSINGEILNIPEHYQYNLKPSFCVKIYQFCLTHFPC